MNGYKTSQQSSRGPATNEQAFGVRRANLSNRMVWFGSLYVGSLSLLVSIGGSMRLLLTYF